MPTHEVIALAAYYLWLANPDSDADSNWHDAEAQLLANTSTDDLLESPAVADVPAQAHVTHAKK
jgi:hypothetical protein